MGVVIGLLNVRRSLLIKAAPDRIWTHFGSFDVLKAWFGIGHMLHAFEPRVGGMVDLSIAMGEERRHFGGRVLVFEVARELTFESQWAAPHAWPVPTLITIRLTALYDGTLVELFHHGFERFGAAAANEFEGYEGGWDIKHLKALRALVESA